MNDTISMIDAGPRASNSRRTFLTGAAAFSLMPLALRLLMKKPQIPVAPAVRRVAPCVTQRGLEEFVPLVGSTFAVAAASAQPAIKLVLAKAEALKHHRPGVAEQFSLRFKAPAGHPFESRIYQLEHPALGSLELFITAVGSAMIHGEQQNGEAIINFADHRA